MRRPGNAANPAILLVAVGVCRVGGGVGVGGGGGGGGGGGVKGVRGELTSHTTYIIQSNLRTEDTLGTI